MSTTPPYQVTDPATGEVIETFPFATDAEIGDGAVVGPFCHLPPGSSIAPGTTTGAFYTPG